MAKKKKHFQRSDIIRMAESVQRVKDLIIDDLSMPMRLITKHFQEVDSTIRCVVHEDLGYQSHVMRTRC